MKIPWGTIAHLGAQVIRVATSGSSTVETLAGTIGGLGGTAKQNAVLETVQATVSTAFAEWDPLLLFNPRVVAAIRAVIDSGVALQQTIAEELHKAGRLPALPTSTTREP